MIDDLNEEVAGPVITPVSLSERISSLDVMRGFALLGILVLNMQDFAGPPGPWQSIPPDVVAEAPHKMLDISLLFAEWLFFESKMRGLFTILFGASTILLIDRIERKSGPGRAADIFHRRNMWLLIFGVMHAVFIWIGDILFYYGAMALLVLYPFRNVSGKRLIAVGLATATILGSLAFANRLYQTGLVSSALLEQGAHSAQSHNLPLTPSERAELAKSTSDLREQIQGRQKDIRDNYIPYLSLVKNNAGEDIKFSAIRFGYGFWLEWVGMMLLGMGLFKTGFLQGNLPISTYLKIAIGGFIISMTIIITGLCVSIKYDFNRSVTGIWMTMPYEIQEIAGTLAIASSLLIIVRLGIFNFAQHALAAVGRMAFSNYILTSIICQLIFHSKELALYGEIEFYQQIYFILAVWGIIILFSQIWLRFFAYGPLEWAWRSLTYWKLQPVLAVAK